MQNKEDQENEKMNFFFISNLFSFPIATVVVAHSPTPSAVNITAFRMVMESTCSMT